MSTEAADSISSVSLLSFLPSFFSETFFSLLFVVLSPQFPWIEEEIYQHNNYRAQSVLQGRPGWATRTHGDTHSLSIGTCTGCKMHGPCLRALFTLHRRHHCRVFVFFHVLHSQILAIEYTQLDVCQILNVKLWSAKWFLMS